MKNSPTFNSIGSASKPPEASEENNGIPRRQFLLRFSTAAIAAVIGQGCGNSHSTNKESNSKKRELLSPSEILHEIPDDFQGAKIEKHEVEGAIAVFIHVADFHNDPDLVDEQKRKIESAVQTVQGENVSILEMLIKRCQTSIIFKEGVSEANKDTLLRRIGEIQALEQSFNSCNDPRMKEALGKELLRDLESLKYALGAAGFLAFRGEIQLEAAETREGNDLTKEDQKDPKKKFNNRERIAIDLAIKDQRSNAKIVVFGENHAFFERIQEWNRQHPDRKLSHVKITSAILYRWMKEVGKFTENR